MNLQRGFTLTELVLVILLTGILAAVAIPRVVSKQEFGARAAYDFTMSGLRFAQKSAMTMRRNVCVAMAGGSLSVTYASSAGVGQSCAAANTLSSPANNLPFSDPSNALPAGSVYASSASVTFGSDGTPLSGPSSPITTPLVITVTGFPTSVTVEPVAGYVH